MCVELNSNLDNTESTVEKIRSHVGMIIHSTTLDTMAKVINIYGGTTWEKIEGRMLLGQSSSYAVNSTGGSATNTLSTANLPSHTHSVGAHSHGLNNHTHSVPAHVHGLNNHTHSIPALSGTAASAGDHVHELWGGVYGGTGRMYYGSNVAGGGSAANCGYVTTQETPGIMYAHNSGTHTHSVTTNANTTGKASGNTANSSALTSGAASGSTAKSSAFNSGATGSGTAVNNMPPYKTVYIWERTA